MSDIVHAAASTAHQLVLERLLARFFQDHPDELADFETECLETAESFYDGDVKTERVHLIVQHCVANLESLFRGVHKSIGKTSENPPSHDAA